MIDLQKLLESLEYNAVTFMSAEHFLESNMIAETTCVITDMQMPRLNGLELQEALRSRGYQTPVVVTGYPDEKTPDPRISQWSGRLPEQAVRRKIADRMPDGCDQVAIIAGVVAAHSMTPC